MMVNWMDELKNGWHRVQKQTKFSLELIKQDRIRRNMSFDDKFKADFLRAANTVYEKSIKKSLQFYRILWP